MLPSASRLERANACALSNVLPAVEREGGDDQTQGRVVHAFLEACRNNGRDEALAKAPDDYRELCAAIDLTSLPVKPESFAAEVAFAYGPDTDKARELGRGIGRNYASHGALTQEFTGTADVVGLMDDDGVIVCDFKPRWSPHVTPAKDNWQLRALALFAARAYGRSRATVEIVHVGPDGAWFDRAELEPYDLDTIALQLEELRDRIEDLQKFDAPPAKEGPWCRHCPSFVYCPAKTRLAASLALVKLEGVVHLSPEKAGEARARLHAAKEVLKRIEETLDDYARQAPYTMPDGTVVAPTEKRIERIDSSSAKAVLERLGLMDLGEWSVTKTAITRGAGKAKADEVLAELRKAGAMKVTLTNPVVETRPRR